MRSMLTAFVALTALALPVGLPAVALAQSELSAEINASSEDTGRFVTSEVTAPTPARDARPEVQDRRGGGRGGDGAGDRGGDRRGRDGNGGGDRGGDGGGHRDRDRGGDRGGPDTGNGPERWNRPNPPVVTTPPTQDRGGQDRGGRGRDGNGQDWNRGNDGRGRDNGGNQGRDRGSDGRGRDNDGRGAGGWNNGGWNNGGWNNGSWDRDRNNGGRHWQDDRNGRRDYDGFRNRWNQNDWRRDWNRSRSNDWWRNDRGFRGYTGFRSGFYFAPNYGYYSVPRNYWGQRWYQGDYLPSVFWRYSLSDYRTYGLGYPPPGTRWVAVDTTIYLIDSADGYIIEVIHDAWRW